METKADRLKKARRAAGFKTARDAARSIGLVYSTYAGHENNSREYDDDDAVVYARKFKVPLEWLITGKQGTVSAMDKRPLATIPIVGIVRAGLWQEADAGDHGLYQDAPAAPDVPPEWQYAFTVEGTSLNLIATPGDILICMDVVKARYSIQQNDLVIVERSRFDGQMVERTAKRIRKSAAGFELWPESTDPAYQEPILIDGVGESDEVRVVAKVLWIMRKP